MRSPLLAPALLFGGVIIASCAAPVVREPAHARPPGVSAGPAAEPGLAVPAAGPARFAHRARPAPPAAPPPPVVTAPMKGEPAAASLKETRLEVSSCEAATLDEAEGRVRAMRAAVDQSFRSWHDQQPGCWESMREEYRMRKEEEAAAAAWGAGGLGLSGVGAGGGGRGEGIGLGSIGTVGHGAGTGSGRLHGEHASSAAVAQAKTASGTNNQVASVDEADIVKTDGRYVYIASNGALQIVEAMNPRMVSVTKLHGTTVRELFVKGDRAVVYTSNGAVRPRCTYGYDCAFGGDGSTTNIIVLDIANRAEPKVVRELELSGSLMAARRIGDAVHTVVADGDSQAPAFETWPSGMQACGNPEKTVREKFARLKADNERKIRAQTSTFPTLREQGRETRLCNGLLRTPLHDGKAFTSVVSFDLASDHSAPTSATLQSRPGVVFASADALYLSVVHRKQGAAGAPWYSFYPSVDEASEIHKFSLGSSGTATRYVGSGVVPGHVLNQFAMDEWYGYLRVATTRGRVPDPKVSSSISILAPTPGGNLVRVGAIDKIAPGEDIRSVRFDDDRGYIVTFKKTDPLFVVDLAQPSSPAILGELKIPGFSTYLHRLDPDHLLSIGFDANDHGDFAYFDGVILQLFDVKEPTRPKLVHKEKIGSRGSSSQAATDHLAFNYLPEQGLLALPMTICEGGGDGQFGGTLAFSGLLVYDVDLEKGFTRLGGVDHGTKGVSCSTWWSKASSAVKRSVFLDDLVYSIADDRVKVQRMEKFGVDVADLALRN
ncbi:MAG TPA: beta-propeller domain-containing protein [Labilithrix sp.]|nr:beta-propeller domain-containing protein [Labilithrix sp.]